MSRGAHRLHGAPAAESSSRGTHRLTRPRNCVHRRDRACTGEAPRVHAFSSGPRATVLPRRRLRAREHLVERLALEGQQLAAAGRASVRPRCCAGSDRCRRRSTTRARTGTRPTKPPSSGALGPASSPCAPRVSTPISDESFMIWVCRILPMLATDCPPPFAASALPRSAFQRPTSSRVASSASFWRRCGSFARPVLRAQLDQVGQAQRLHAARLLVARRVARGAAEHAALRARGGEARVRAARADTGALEVQRGLRHGPAVARAADEVRVVHDRAVDEHLVEERLARHLAQRADLHAGLVEREREPRDARVLGNAEVGAREEHAVVGAHRVAAPHLLAGDHPVVTVAHGARSSGPRGRSPRRAR